MKIGVPKERLPQEKRVAVSPDSIKKLIALGFEVVVESGAGDGSSFSDGVYKEAGASIARDAAGALSDVDIVFSLIFTTSLSRDSHLFNFSNRHSPILWKVYFILCCIVE